MDPKSFVDSAVLLLVVAAIAVAVFRHFGLGSILGLLVTGVIVGPHTPGPFVTTEVEGVRHFTELGVVLLMFLIGLEMKPRRLWELRRTLFGLGSLQIIVSALAIAAYFKLFQPNWSTALLIGSSFALSSTAFRGADAQGSGRDRQPARPDRIRRAADAGPRGGAAAGAGADPRRRRAAAQETCPVGADWSGQRDGGAGGLGGRYLVPRILDHLARQNNREAFLLAAMAAVFIAAWAMDHAGMSMALGAFLMGMMLSTSRYSLQIEASMEPHKGLLMSLFFVAVGMSVDVGALAQHPFEFGLHVLAIIAIKVVVLYRSVPVLRNRSQHRLEGGLPARAGRRVRLRALRRRQGAGRDRRSRLRDGAWRSFR
jgi:glutathione-regulated potassium-efflux system ancillary protein KefC